mgnify:CR=1 FL=1
MPIRANLKSLVESNGAAVIADKIVSELFLEEKSKRLNPDSVSYRQLWEAFVGPVEETLSIGNPSARYYGRTPLVEAFDSTAFAFVTGNVIAAKVLGRYESLPSTLNQLIDPPVKSVNRTERFVGFQSVGGIKDVDEGKEYAEAFGADKGVEVPEPKKQGAVISFTEETILFDKTGQINRLADDLARRLQQTREAKGIRTITEQAGYPGYYPVTETGQPVSTTLYRAAAAGTAYYNKTINKLAANPLVDWNSLDAALALFMGVVDEDGEPILIDANRMLCPRAKLATALRIVGATEERSVSGSNTTIAGSILNRLPELGGMSPPLYSPYLPNSADWWIGDFARQWIEREIWPIQTVELDPIPEKDILFRFKVRMKTQFVAVDDKFVIYNVG